jgi:hypothetical protein
MYMSSKILENEWGDVIARRANNDSVSSIVGRYDCSPATVYSVLKRATAVESPAEEFVGRTEPFVRQLIGLAEAPHVPTSECDPETNRQQ